MSGLLLPELDSAFPMAHYSFFSVLSSSFNLVLVCKFSSSSFLSPMFQIFEVHLWLYKLFSEFCGRDVTAILDIRLVMDFFLEKGNNVGHLVQLHCLKQ